MRMSSLFATATFVAVFGMTSSASAESTRITAIRDGLQELATRSKAIQRHVDHSPPRLRKEVGTFMDAIARDCVKVSTRLAIISLLGRSDEEGTPVEEMEATMESVTKRVTMVEHWYSMR
jgi:hypothetical protein